MRDPNRINDILKRLGEVWRTSPDLRLGQLLLNVTGDMAPALFNVEDEDLIEGLEQGAAHWRELEDQRKESLRKRFAEIEARRKPQ